MCVIKVNICGASGGYKVLRYKGQVLIGYWLSMRTNRLRKFLVQLPELHSKCLVLLLGKTIQCGLITLKKFVFGVYVPSIIL